MNKVSAMMLLAGVLSFSLGCPGGDDGGEATPEATDTPDGGEEEVAATSTPNRGSQSSVPLRVVSVSVTPEAPTAADPLQAEAEATGGSRLRYQWLVNDEPVSGAIAPELNPGPYKKGDEVTVEVTVSDGSSDSEPERANPVTIGNQPPKITSMPGSDLRGYRVAAEDPDGDELKFSVEQGPDGTSISEDGVFSWEEPYEPGKHVIKIAATDPDGAKVVQTIPVTIPETEKKPQPQKTSQPQK